MKASPIKILIVCGPTASGKSALALQVAQNIGGVIVNADSMQIYQGLDIGTAKPTAAERALVPHYLFDVATPDADFDAAAYAVLADKVIAAAAEQNQIPIIVGGTGLYLRALLYGLCAAPEVSPEIRARYRELLVQHDAPYMHGMLQQCDPEMARRLHANDYVRVLRALEVLEATGESLAVWQERHGGFVKPRYTALQIGVKLERAVLYARIAARVDAMLTQGLETEVRGLLAQGYTPELKALNAIGYKQMTAYIKGEVDYSEMVRLMKRDTRHYAKRQLTWSKANQEITWLHPAEKERFLDLVYMFFKHI